MHPDRTLIGIVGVSRHADRTPKQKIKLKTRHPAIVAIARNRDQGHSSRSLIAKAIESAIITTQIASERDRLQRISELLHEDGVSVYVRLSSSNGLAIVVCKWGGILTRTGVEQAKALGRSIREKIRAECTNNDWETFIKQSAVYASSLNRVQRTASFFWAAFREESVEAVAGSVQTETDLEPIDQTENSQASITDLKSKLKALVNGDSPLHPCLGEFDHVLCELNTLVASIIRGLCHIMRCISEAEKTNPRMVLIDILLSWFEAFYSQRGVLWRDYINGE